MSSEIVAEERDRDGKGFLRDAAEAALRKAEARAVAAEKERDSLARVAVAAEKEAATLRAAVIAADEFFRGDLNHVRSVHARDLIAKIVYADEAVS